MPVLKYERVPSGLSGEYGQPLVCPEAWDIQVTRDTPKALILAQVTGAIQGGIKWGSPHWEFPALKAMKFDLKPMGEEGKWYRLEIIFTIPPPKLRIKTNGIPEDVWERTGTVTMVPVFKDSSGVFILNSAKDPVEALERERGEQTWSLTKFYADEATLDAHAAAYDERTNEAEWKGYAAHHWKCYFLGAKKVSISKIDGDDDAGTLAYIESRWEFKLDRDGWKLKPWDLGFMQLVGSGEKKTILGSDGKPVKQPVALNTDGTARAAGEMPSVIRDGEGAAVYLTANLTTGFGTPSLLG